KQMIAQYDSLYTPMLDSVMGEIGYGDWWGFVNEHIVRLGHIRVARLTDDNEANELIKADVHEYKFILLPDAEERIKEYEKNRAKYKTIDDYLPELIKQFGDYSKKDIDDKITEG